jgi:type I restriction enzyme S subunit
MNENWEKVKLKDIFSKVNGLWTGKKEPFVEVKVYTMTNFTKDSFLNKDKQPREIVASLSQFEKRKLQKGDILVEKSGGGPKQPVGRAVLFDIDNDENNTFSNFTTRLRLNETFKDKVYPNFVHHFLRLKYIDGETEKFQRNSTNIRNLQLEEYLEQSFSFPSLPEQQRIVSILDKAFAAIDKVKANAEQNLKNAKELFESYLQGVFERKVHGNKYASLNDLCELIVDCEHKTAPTQETGYPSIRTPNIGKGELILENVNHVSHDTYVKWTRRAIPKAGDLILAREAPAGNIAVIPENIEVCLGPRTVLLRPKKDKFIPKYLAYLLLSRDVQKILLSHSTGATVQHINMKDIRAFKIYNLSDLKEQEIIVRQLDALRAETQKLEAVYQKKICDLEELKKSILQKAFAGELRGDEPAESETKKTVAV